MAFSAFHSVKGSFIPAPPVPGMLHRKIKGCQGFYEHSSAHAPLIFTPFFPAVVLGGPWMEHSKTFQFHPSSPRYGSHNSVSHSFTIPFTMHFFLIWVKEKEKKETNSVDEETKATPWGWKETVSIHQKLPDTDKAQKLPNTYHTQALRSKQEPKL